MGGKKRGQIGWNELVPWIIGIGVLILMVFFYVLLKGKGIGALDFLKNLLKFR